MKVGGLQMDIFWDEPRKNFYGVERALSQARDAGYELVALPEMFATGFMMDPQGASQVRAETEAFLGEMAQTYDLTLIGGTAELLPGDGQGRAANQALMVGPSGQKLGVYQKIHPFSLAKEGDFFKGGESTLIQEVGGLRLSPFICYDLRFPEVFRAVAPSVSLIVVIANWPQKRIHAWKTLLQARAIECQAYILGVNRVGEGAGLIYSGDSMLVDPLGQVLSHLEGEAGWVGGEVDASRVETLRARYSFLADRRVEIYRNL